MRVIGYLIVLLLAAAACGHGIHPPKLILTKERKAMLEAKRNYEDCLATPSRGPDECSDFRAAYERAQRAYETKGVQVQGTHWDR